MKFLFIDIENTVIDDLVNCNFLEENCKKITKLLKEKDTVSFNFFTWGWKMPTDVDINIVNSMLVKFGIDQMNISCDCRVITKSASVQTAIETGWLKQEDFDRAIEHGMMAEFGISKISCFTEFIQTGITETLITQANATVKDPIEFWLIDDLVEKKETIELYGGNVKIVLVNPTELT